MLKKFVSSKPVVIVSGCTGTGKSDLAIAIAKKFDGEVISADSMQIYRGLDIVTNKVTEQEMDGIRHHLMSFYDPTMAEFNVQSFRESALQIMEDLWAENKLPIIAGGTQYYTESIMYRGNLVDAKHDNKIRQDLEKMSNEELYEKLKQVDPESAEMVHINNRARVLRAVEIFLLTGTKKSQIIEMQKNSDLDGGLRFPNTLLIHVDANEQVLNQRLKSRIGKMTDRGLKQELTSFYDEHKNKLKTHGVFQSIGIKEFLPFLQLSTEERQSELGQKLFLQGTEDLTLHTWQYAKRQRKWLRSRFLTRQTIRELPKIVALDSSEIERFLQDLVPTALEIVNRFLAGKDLGLEGFDPKLVSDPLKLVQEEQLKKPNHSKKCNRIISCEICGIDVHGEDLWKSHLNGAKHKNRVKKMKTIVENKNC